MGAGFSEREGKSSTSESGTVSGEKPDTEQGVGSINPNGDHPVAEPPPPEAPPPPDHLDQ